MLLDKLANHKTPNSHYTKKCFKMAHRPKQESKNDKYSRGNIAIYLSDITFTILGKRRFLKWDMCKSKKKKSELSSRKHARKIITKRSVGVLI